MTSQLAFLYRRHRRGQRRWWALLVAQLIALAGFATAQAAPVCTTNGNQGTCTFTYTGTAERWVVPPHATQATFNLYGAQGGGYRGQGGRVTAQFAVTPGAVYQINVGGQGGVLGGGFNGGGQGGDGEGTDDGGGGGGASDVRTGSFALVDRILVAGGGGGSGGKILGADGGLGGAGGYPSGENGGDGEDRGTPIPGGGGGSQHNGVPIGGTGAGNGGDGGVGVGGNGESDISSGQGGGGGGGGYGGGGGGAAYARGGGAGSGGGGGSSYGPAGATFENGVRVGHGMVIITYSLESTPPVADPVQDPPANAYGWNNGNVQVQWRWSDPSTGSGQGSGLDPANCANSTLVTAEGRTELTQTCQDRVGNVGSATYTVQIDKTRPIANPTVSPAANANGWHNSDVTITWNWIDPAPGAGLAAGLDAANCPAAASSSREGSSTLNSDCADLATNRANQSYNVKVDKTAPVVTVTGVSNGAVYTLGSVPTAGCNTTDALSGVATPATLNVTGGNGDGTGSFTATCNLAADLAGNNSTAVSVSYTVNALPTATPTATETNTPTVTPSSTNSPTATPTATNTLVPATATGTNTPTVTPSSTSSPTATPTATNTLVRATATNTPTNTPTATPTTPSPTAEVAFYLSSSSNGKLARLVYQDEDILRYTQTGGWSLFFDGSDVGVGNTDLDAFHLMTDSTILMSFEHPLPIPPLGTVADADVVRFTPTGLGPNTSGAFSRYFTGAQVGLTTRNEDIDAIALDPSGNLVISTNGGVSVPGVRGQDEDLLRFVATSLGEQSAGTWTLLLDGSTLGLTAGEEDLGGAWIDPAQGNCYLSTKGDFFASGHSNSISGDSDDLFGCAPTGNGATDSCFFFAFFDGDLIGLKKSIDGVSLDLTGGTAGQQALATSADNTVDNTVDGPQFELLPEAEAEPDPDLDTFDLATADEMSDEETFSRRLYLPLINR